jgi:hypothetical protein
MKSTHLALVVVVLCGSLSACRQEPPAPETETTPPPMATEPVPAAPDPMVTDPAMPVPTEDVEEDDTPHTGGDRVGTGSGGGTGAANEQAPPEG